MAYIKLGPKGTFFASKKYNLYLVKGNAAIADDTWLYNDLAQFIITGYFVEISENEYENIKLNQSNNPNLSYLPKGVNTIGLIEPVESMTSTVPGNVPDDASYIVNKGASNEWLSLAQKIVSWNGFAWQGVKPYDGLIVPIKDLGIAATYKGTYPSGHWDIDLTQSSQYIDDIIGGTNPGGNDGLDWDQLHDLILQEIEDREQGDTDLLTIINNLQLGLTNPTAADVSVENTSNIFAGPNVQLALEGLASQQNAQGQTLNNLYNQVQVIDQIVQNLLNQSPGQSGNIQHVVYIAAQEISYSHNLGVIPQVSLLEAVDGDLLISQNPDVTGVSFQELAAKPYDINTTSVSYSLTRPRNIVLTINH